MKRNAVRGAGRQRGAAAVEFALVAGLFFMLLIGIMEMGRLLFYWNTVTEVTRLGARLAVVCDLNDADIEARMVKLLPQVAGHVTVTYEPASCNVNTCQQVTVAVASSVAIPTYIPYVPLSMKLPAFATTLPRESMQSTFNGTANPVCQ
ncbi:MAG TPA: TadE/TadG family type IV pilus assembly protein [Burkholderiaceae bacterium]|nr:TadE/TadG family type IV pilus assembly protein [Burkholderiaceae bacterium]